MYNKTSRPSREGRSHVGGQKFQSAHSSTRRRAPGKQEGSGSSSSGSRGRFSSTRRSSVGSRRPSHGGGNRRSGGNRGRQTLNISSFINKAVVTTEEFEKFVPEHSFSDFALDNTLKATIIKHGYTDPTPIQDKTIPHILRGEDVVGLANTGTGKTAAFLIPLIHKILGDKNEQVLVLTPTRELAIQIEDELKKFTHGMNIHSVVCVGGAPMGPQLHKLRLYNHVVIGTPGRTIDLIKRGALKLGGVKTVVLDEADRMLDMGFINDIRLIMGKVPKERHTLCFSATMSHTIEELIKDFLKSPVTISVKTGDTAKNVEQDVVKVRGLDKVDVLHDLLINPEFKKVLIFGRTKHGVEKLCTTLVKRGIKAESIHGNKSQSQRQRALSKFKDGFVQALIATDVAARGLDIENVSHVINYEVPETYDDYVHRIGRTGRGEKKGKALTFVD